MNKTKSLIIVISTILLGSLLGMTSLSRLKFVPANAPLEQYYADRAMEHIEAISNVLYPTGSEKIERVRAYIIKQLDEMGLSYEIQERTVAVPQ